MADRDDPKPSDFDDPNDWWILQFHRVVQRLADQGVDESEAPIRAVEAIQESIDNASPDHAAAIETTGVEFLSDSAAYRLGFAERLRVHWGDSLDLFEIFVAVVEDGGQKFGRRNLRAEDTYTLLLDVLTQLNGQAVRVAREVHALLTAGFPLGAHSLARTVHEISVRAGVLRDFGATEGHEDLAEQFVLHDQIVNYRDAVVYQRDVERLGYEPLGDDEMVRLKKAHDDLIARFGPSFGSPYGWATGLPGLSSPSRPTFEDLEALTRLDHFRGIYRWSSHFVHGDAKGLRLGRVERGGSAAVLTNATNNMLADPAQHTLIGLFRVFTSMVTAAQPFAFYDMLLCGSLRILLDKADQLFVDAERAVDEAEERLQEEYRSQGQVLTPWGAAQLDDSVGAG